MKKATEIFYKKPFLIFLLFLVAAYLPVFLPFFNLKNDILTQNLPTRFVFSESLYSGFEPFWNPYLHFGNPQYGDMNNGFWNPIQWLIGSTVGYNIYSITYEEMFYILIGGWGIYKTFREFFDKETAILSALAYMCCGFITGRMQYLCWMTGVAYFPYVLLYFIRINKIPLIKNFVWGGLCVFLFVASSHPGLIIGAAYFFAFILFAIYFNRKDFFRHLYHPKFWRINLLFFFISCILSVVVIVSNIDVLQYISRGQKVSMEQALWAPTTLQSYISFFVPLAVHKSTFFDTDIAMRNMYIGIAHLAGIILTFRHLTRKMWLTIALPLLFFVLLSAGGYFKMFAWKILPLLGFVRLNGEFSYFVILILLVWGAAGIQSIIKQKTIATPQLLTYLFITSLILAVFAIILIIITHSSILFSGNLATGSFKGVIKSVIDHSSFCDLLFIQSLIQATTVYLLRLFFKNRTHVFFILGVNLVIITWLILPFTGLGMTSKKEIQEVINTFPKGIQPQKLVSINKATYINPADEKQFSLISSYSKKIGYTKPDQYPVELISHATFAADTALFNFITKQAFMFLSTDTIVNSKTSFDSSLIQVLKVGPGDIKCIVINNDFNWLTLLQNDYPYWEVKVDGKPVYHFTAFRTFISVKVPPGKHLITFKFKPRIIKIIMWINMTLLLTALIIVLFLKFSRLQLFK